MIRHMAAACGALVALAALICAPAEASELRRETIASTALKRDMPYIVYVPDGYQDNARHYPVLYLLHGAGGDETAWLSGCDIKRRVDRLIASGAIPATLVVMPGCPGCWWVDGAKDKAETAFWTELVPGIAKRYRTIPTRDGLLMAGLSAGGYGAIRFAMKYPDRVGAVAAFSPAVYATTPPLESSSRTQPPFLRPDGKFDQAKWTALNYPNLIQHYFAQKYRVPFYLTSGDSDSFGITFETVTLFKRIVERQPQLAELRIIDGGHDWQVWSATTDDALKYLYRFAPRSKEQPGSTPVAIARQR